MDQEAKNTSPFAPIDESQSSMPFGSTEQVSEQNHTEKTIATEEDATVEDDYIKGFPEWTILPQNRLVRRGKKRG